MNGFAVFELLHLNASRSAELLPRATNAVLVEINNRQSAIGHHRFVFGDRIKRGAVDLGDDAHNVDFAFATKRNGSLIKNAVIPLVNASGSAHDVTCTSLVSNALF